MKHSGQGHGIAKISQFSTLLTDQVQRVIELKDGVGLDGDGLQVSLGGRKGRLAGGLRNRGEGRGADSDGGEKESGLHFSLGTEQRRGKVSEYSLVCFIDKATSGRVISWLT